MNLDFAADGEAFAPVAEAAPVTVGGRVRDGVSFDGGAPSLRFGSNADVGGELVGGSVVYANARRDSDIAVRAQPFGIELFDVLRSAESPETWTLRLEGDVELRERRRGGFDILRAGEAVGLIGDVLAADAEGQPIDAHAELVGPRTIRFRVEHRDDDVLYPLVVDPVYEWYDWHYGKTNFFPWKFTASAWTFTGFSGPGEYGNGLYVQSTRGLNWFDEAQSGYWTYWPQDGTRIANWGAVFMDHNVIRNDAGATCQFAGLINRWTNDWEDRGTPNEQRWEDCATHWGWRAYYSNDGGTENRFISGEYHRGGAWRIFNTRLGHAELQLTDDGPPSLSASAASGWTTDPFVNATAADHGFGIREVQLNGGRKYFKDCNGTYSWAVCDGSRDVTVELDDGITPLAWQAWDGAGQASAVHDRHTAKVDRRPPEITGVGEVVDAAAARAAQTDGSNEFSLRLHVADGVPNGQPHERRSGVDRIQVFLDDALALEEQSPASCADSCEIKVDDLVASADDLAEGDHKVRVVAWDRLQQRSEKTWAFKVLGPEHYQGELNAWRAEVERRMRTILSDGMPTPPGQWRDPESCTASASAVEGCERAATDWGGEVRRWLERNLAGLREEAKTLPDVPTYNYGRRQYARHFVTLLGEEFALARKSASEPAAPVTAAISFSQPMNAVTLKALLAPLASDGGLAAMRGTVPAGEQAIIGSEVFGTLPGPPELAPATAIDQFYAGQLEDLDEQIADFESQRSAAVTAGDLDERDALDEALAGMRAGRPVLESGDAFVTGIALRLPLPSLLQLRSVPAVGVSRVQILASIEQARGALEGTMSAGEWASIAAKSSSPPPSGAGTAARVAAEPRFPTCVQRGETNPVPLRRDALYAQIFMPTRHEFNVNTTGERDNLGLHIKQHSLSFRWVKGRSLQWYCFGGEGRRGYEEDSRVPSNAKARYSTDWLSEKGTRAQARYPGYAIDDLGVGYGADPYEIQPYPDFALTSDQGRALQYGIKYYTKFRTNSGESDAGDLQILVTGSAVSKKKPGGEQLYCNTAPVVPNYSIRTRLGACMFSRMIKCVGDEQLGANAKHVKWDWINGDACRFG